MHLSRLPLTAQHGKTAAGKTVEDVRKFDQELCKQDMTIRKWKENGVQSGRTQRKTVLLTKAVGQTQIETDTDHGPCTIHFALQLDKNTAQLGIVMQDIVRPLEFDPRRSAGFKGMHHGNAYGQRETGQVFDAPIEAPEHGKSQARFRRSQPASSTTATSSRLPLGHNDTASRRTMPGTQ